MMDIRHLKESRSPYPRRKSFTLLYYTFYLIPNEILEPYVEPKGGLSMYNDVYSKYINLTI